MNIIRRFHTLIAGLALAFIVCVVPVSAQDQGSAYYGKSPFLVKNPAVERYLLVFKALEAQDLDQANTYLQSLIFSKNNAWRDLAEGTIYRFGFGREKSPERAIILYKKAAERLNMFAMFHLGEMYENGEGTGVDLPIAIGWYKRSLDHGFLPGALKLGRIYYSGGNDVAADRARAAEFYRIGADQGNAPCAYNLAILLEYGVGASQDLEEAVNYHSIAARAGNTKAMVRLGRILGGEQYAQQDTNAAIRWIRTAAEQGEAEGMYLYALAFQKGIGVARDPAEALRWLKAAAEKGDVEAIARIGLYYHSGEGVTQDLAEAAKWYQQAADLGHLQAMVSLGELYFSGSGVKQDFARAEELFRRAAEREYPQALFDLGVMYFQGSGVPQSKEMAVEWWKKAASLGDEKALAALSRVQ